MKMWKGQRITKAVPGNGLPTHPETASVRQI
jgi:hypothetical protein